MIVGLGLGVAASSHFTVSAAAEVIRSKKGITAIGNAQVDTAQSKFGGASALFDGNGDYLQIKTDSDLQFTSSESWTVEFWARPANNNSGPAVIGYQNAGAYPGWGFYFGQGGAGHLNFYDGGNWRSLSTGITGSTWYHIAVSSNAGTYKLFLNGTQQGTDYTAPSNINNVNTDIFIGTLSTLNAWYNGHIDEVRISNTARYTSNFTPSTTAFVNDENTLVLLHMDGTDASTVFEDDNGVRSKKGVTANGNAQVDTAQSKFGGASALFDGTGDYLSIPYHPDLRFGTGDFTFECWFRDNGRVQSFPLLMSNINAFTTGGWVLHDRHNSYSTKLTFWVYSYNTGAPMLISTTTVSENIWYHIAVVRNGTTWKMYINGTEEDSVTSSVNLDSGNTTSASTVSGSSSAAFTGHIDEVRWSNVARYTANFTPATTPFVNDANTVLLIHADGTDASTHFEDDNGASTPGRTQKHITAIGNAQIDTAQSKFGGSSYLGDGSGDGLKVSPNTDFIFGTNDWTVEMWYRPSGTAADVLIDTRANPSDNGITLYYDTTKLTYYSGNAIRINGNAWSTNTWQHVAIVRSGNDHKLYMDGTQVGSTYTATNSITSVATSIFIGERSEDPNSLSFAGHIDEVRISDVARYSANFTPQTTPFQNDANTLLLLHMDGTDGSTVFTDDIGGRAKVGVAAIGNAQVDTAQSKFGGSSANFDGSGDSLLTSTTEKFNLGTNDFTFEGWVRTTSLAANQIFLDFREASSSTVVPLLQIDTDGRLNYYVYPNYAIQSNTGVISVDTWYHFALVRSSGVSKLYLDGTQVGSNYTDTTDYGSRYLRLGKHATLTNGLFGWLDEIRISNTARYTANFTPSTTPFQNDSNTLLLLHCDGTDASTVFTDDNGVPPDYDYGA